MSITRHAAATPDRGHGGGTDLDGLHTYFVDTPLAFSDGTPIGLYIEHGHAYTLITDDAMTLWALRGIGHDFEENHGTLDALRSIAEEHGFTLSGDGEIRLTVANTAYAGAFARTLRMFSDITDWEKVHPPGS